MKHYPDCNYISETSLFDENLKSPCVVHSCTGGPHGGCVATDFKYKYIVCYSQGFDIDKPTKPGG